MVSCSFRYAMKTYQGIFGKAEVWIREWTESPSGVLVCQIPVERCCQTEAAGNGKDLSCGIGGSVTGEIAYRFRDFLRQAHAAQWDVPHKQIPEIIRQVLLDSFCGGHAGQNGVASDLTFGFLHSN